MARGEVPSKARLHIVEFERTRGSDRNERGLFGPELFSFPLPLERKPEDRVPEVPSDPELFLDPLNTGFLGTLPEDELHQRVAEIATTTVMGVLEVARDFEDCSLAMQGLIVDEVAKFAEFLRGSVETQHKARTLRKRESHRERMRGRLRLM